MKKLQVRSEIILRCLDTKIIDQTVSNPGALYYKLSCPHTDTVSIAYLLSTYKDRHT